MGAGHGGIDFLRPGAGGRAPRAVGVLAPQQEIDAAADGRFQVGGAAALATGFGFGPVTGLRVLGGRRRRMAQPQHRRRADSASSGQQQARKRHSPRSSSVR